MVASVKTAKEVVSTILKYVPAEKVPDLICELRKIPGNQSFLETIELIEKLSKTKGQA